MSATRVVTGVQQMASGNVGQGLKNAWIGFNPYLAAANTGKRVYEQAQAKDVKADMAASEEAARRDAEEEAKRKKELENRRMGYLSLIRTTPTGLSPMNSGSRGRLIGF